ncbi:ABC-type Fe3+-hydroxamate transport system substrate-binding protein [Bradyrhizobium sp. USDA 10063]
MAPPVPQLMSGLMLTGKADVMIDARDALFERLKRAGQAIETIVRRKAKSQPFARPVEATAPDVASGQFGVQGRGIGMGGKAKQRGPSDEMKAGRCQDIVELTRLASELRTHRISPRSAPQGGGADVKRRAGGRPWTERRGDTLDDVASADREAEAKSGEPIELAEGTQHEDGKVGAHPDSADRWINVGKGLIDDQPATTTVEPLGNVPEHPAIRDTSIRIVGTNDDSVKGAFRQRGQIIHGDDLSASAAPCGRMLAIGRSDNRNRSGTGEIRDPLNEGLRAGGGRDTRMVGHTIGFARGGEQVLLVGTRWQARPCTLWNGMRNRPRPGIDPGRQVEPVQGLAAVARNSFRQITAVLHDRFMPSIATPRETLVDALRPAIGATFLLLAALCGAHIADAADLPRVASINVCTDQLLLALADPSQILGLSPYSRDPARSWNAEKAAAYPRLSGEAEDVLILRPDAVVAGRFTKRATRELLKENRVRVIEFDAARSLEDVKDQIRRMGELLHQTDRAASEIRRLDIAIQHAKEALSQRSYRVLALSRRGWVSGGGSLMSSMLATIGLKNAASDLGYKLGGFASLEAIVKLRPDLLLVSDGGDFAEDEGEAFLMHPALERFYPPSKRLVIPEKLTVCGGPMLSEALERLVAELNRVAR